MAERHEHLGEFHRRADPVDDGAAVLSREVSRQLGHARTAEHDGFRTILGESAGNLRIYARPRIGFLVFEREDRHVGGTNARAPLEAVLHEIVLERGNRAR